MNHKDKKKEAAAAKKLKLMVVEDAEVVERLYF
jgi:hypothetical protein